MTLDEIRAKMPSEELLLDLADFFKMFGDSTRTKILSALELESLNVGDLAATLSMTPSAVSHQLRLLKNAKLVKATKKGKEVVYSLDDDHVTQIVNCGLSHLQEE